FVVEGIRHNIPFLAAIMAHPRWRAGKLSTAFIAEEFPHGFARTPPSAAVTRERRRAISLGGEIVHADVEHDGDAIAVTFADGARHLLRSDFLPGMPL